MISAVGNGHILNLRVNVELNGLQVTVQRIHRGTHGLIRLICHVPPQARCPEGRRNLAIRRDNLVFDFRTEGCAFGFNPFEIMSSFGAQELTHVPAIRFRYYSMPPDKLDVKLFFGSSIYSAQREALFASWNRGGKGWYRRAGVMFDSHGDVLRDGLVFTTSEKHNQTMQPSTEELSRQPSSCLWWPCLVANTSNPGFRMVRCWEQNVRDSQPWMTPVSRILEFPSEDEEWTVLDSEQPEAEGTVFFS